jgi:hypothetical protein
MKEPLDKYVEYFNPRHHEQYRFSYLVTMKKLVFVHLRKQGYSKRDLMQVFRCNISSIRHLENTANDFKDTNDYFKDNWMWIICSKIKPVQVMNNWSEHGNQKVGFKMVLIKDL